MKKVLWIDTETTGLNPKVHGLREVAFIVEVDGVEKEKGVFKINPFTYTSKKLRLMIMPYQFLALLLKI